MHIIEDTMIREQLLYLTREDAIAQVESSDEYHYCITEVYIDPNSNSAHLGSGCVIMVRGDFDPKVIMPPDVLPISCEPKSGV